MVVRTRHSATVFPRRPPAAIVVAAIVVGAILLTAGSAFADDVFVKTRYAKLRAGTSSRDATVTKLKHGAKLTVIGKKGGFLNVKTADGKTGWIARSWTTKELKKRNKFLEGLGRAARGGSGGKDVSFTAGARGLSSQAHTYAKDHPDLKAVVASIEKLEKLEVTMDELDAFLVAGKLGDYKVVPGSKPAASPAPAASTKAPAVPSKESAK